METESETKSWFPFHSNIPISMPSMLVFVSSWMPKKWLSCVHKCQGHLVTLWLWLWSWKSYFVRYILLMCNLEIWLCSQDSGLRTCPQSHPLLNMNKVGNIQSHVVTSLMMPSWSKWFHCTQFAIYSLHLKWNWNYHMQDMDFENSRKQFWFSTSDDFSNRNQNRNLSVSERCPLSHRLWQYLFPCSTIKTDQLWQF